MAESDGDLIIKFSGRIDNLLIKHMGKVILNYKGDTDPPEERSSGYLKNQGKMGVTSSFAKAVYSIPILKAIWHKSYFKKSLKTRFKVEPYKRIKPGKAIAFNKIVAANNKFSSDERPTNQNIIIPQSVSSIEITNAVLHRQGIDFTIPSSPSFWDFPEKEIGLTGAAILCAYNPKRRANKKYELIPKFYIINNFVYTEDNDLSIAFEPEEAERIWKYKNLILYFTIVVISEKKNIIRWSATRQVKLVNE
ncbi:MAG: hypothetical protein P4L35_04015 [Ignavibacteriaceae bacterium]|nr:hypothetical protein [Ignavibacteriaceae bacterium]